MRRNALISDCLKYRYWLKRWWSDDADAPWATWIMLNPSIADAAKDDATIRKCIAFARRWGMAGIYVVNLFAHRSTDPDQLLHVSDPIGPENRWAIRHALDVCGQSGGPIVAGWGAHKAVERLSDRVKRTLRTYDLKCLRLTQRGAPWHPLYVPLAQPLIPFRAFQ